MNEKVLSMIIKVGIPTVVVAAAGVFTFKIVKEYKRQYANLQEQLEQTNDILEETILVSQNEKDELSKTIEYFKDEKSALEEQLEQASNQDIDYTGRFIPNQEFAEMRKQIQKTSEEATDSRLKVVMQPQENLIKHNIFEDTETVAFDVPKDGSKQTVKEKIVEGKRNMRYDVNSKEALEAYKGMLLSDFDEEPEFIMETSIQYDLGIEKAVAENANETVIDYLRGLFNITLPSASNEYDENIIEQMLSQRRQFFGNDSVNSQEISGAELILYWIERLNEDIGMSNIAWAWYLMDNLGVYEAETAEEMASQLEKAMTHEVWKTLENGTELFGIFGLIPGEQQYGIGMDRGRFNSQYQSLLERLSSLAEGVFDDD